MAASAPLLATAAMARVSRPRPHRRVRSHRAGPSRIRATEPNQVPDVGAPQREIERPDMELEAHRDAPDEDTPALASLTVYGKLESKAKIAMLIPIIGGIMIASAQELIPHPHPNPHPDPDPDPKSPSPTPSP